MPISVVVGGQYGSEGKGKVTHILAQERKIRVAIRVGGPNSGHTVVTSAGDRHVFRQLPTPALLPDVLCVLPAGAVVDAEILSREIADVGLEPDRVAIDPFAVVATEKNQREERMARLPETIGSTGSGAGSATWHRIARDGQSVFARDVPCLHPWVRPTAPILEQRLRQRERVLIEGTQGFGLSVLHGGAYPFATSRDTTASAALAEAGLSPIDVDEVVLVLRAFPIRVGGNSGPLPNETDWQTVATEGGHDHDLTEWTTVTRRVRRVARFDASVVVRALGANHPTTIVMNHLDYIDHECCQLQSSTPRVEQFLDRVEGQIGRGIDWLGLGLTSLELRHSVESHVNGIH